MSANQQTRGRPPGIWRAVRGAFAALGPTRAEQILMWEAWWQANRTAVHQEGPLTWVLTQDGYRLVDSHLPRRRRHQGRGDGVTPGPRTGRRAGAPASYLVRLAGFWMTVARRRRAVPDVDPDDASQRVRISLRSRRSPE